MVNSGLPIAVRFSNDSGSPAPRSRALVTCSPAELCAGGRAWAGAAAVFGAEDNNGR